MTRARQAEHFWNRAAAGYARKAIADEAAYRRKLEITRKYLRPDMNTLEVGCGTGSTALLHAPLVRTVLATDLSSAMIEIARRKAAAAAVANVRFEAASIEALTAPRESFDAILALSVLHLVESLERTIARISALLRPGGMLFSNTVCVRDMGPVPTLLVRALAATRLGPPVTAFGTAELLAAMERADFEVVTSFRATPTSALFLACRKRGRPPDRRSS